MSLTIILLSILPWQVMSQMNDISPARILARQKTISENSNLYVTCSTYRTKKNNTGFVYLCKDNVGIERKRQNQDQTDTTFTIDKVGLHHSGNYSCVFSTRDYQVAHVTKRGSNVIQILVIANFLPADVSLAGPMVVSEGDDVELRCSVSSILQTLENCQFVHSYLMKNGSVLQVRPFNVMQMNATFTIEGAVVRDSGQYSCAVLPSKCIQGPEEGLYGKNEVTLEVKGSWIHYVILLSGAGVLILVLLLWFNIKQGCAALSNACKESQPAQTVYTSVAMDKREQNGRGYLEEQDGDPYSMQEDDEFMDDVTDDYSDIEAVRIDTDEAESIYNNVEEMYPNEDV